MKFKLFSYTAVILYVLVMIQLHLLTGLDENIWSSIVINLITDAIGILVTVLLINEFIKRHEKHEEEERRRVAKEKEKHIVNEIIGNKLNYLFTEISSVYINFILKRPATFNEYDTYNSYATQIKEIIENLDTHISAGFRSKPIKTYIVDPKKLMDEGMPKEMTLSYQSYCTEVFKRKIQYTVENFIQRYISVLPDELRKSIYIIENSIDEWVFKTTLELVGKELPMPTTQEDISKLQNEFDKIGKELLYIHEIISKD